MSTPCSDPANNPEDWFIEKDGRQYPDDELNDDEVKDALARRRHAKDECFVKCYFRTQCLGIALSPQAPDHGTWGGYYQEELRKIRKLRDENRERRLLGE